MTKPVAAKAKLMKKVGSDLMKGKAEKTIEFLQLYVESGDAKQAWLDVGNSTSTQHLAMQRIRENWRLVEELVRLRIGRHVPFALNGIVELATTAKQEAVRLKALQDILFRAGYDAPMKIETMEKEAKDMSNRELDAELTRLLARVNNEADTAKAAEEIH